MQNEYARYLLQREKIPNADSNYTNFLAIARAISAHEEKEMASNAQRDPHNISFENLCLARERDDFKRLYLEEKELNDQLEKRLEMMEAREKFREIRGMDALRNHILLHDKLRKEYDDLAIRLNESIQECSVLKEENMKWVERTKFLIRMQNRS